MQKILSVILLGMLTLSGSVFAEESVQRVVSVPPSVPHGRGLQASALQELARMQAAQTPAASPQKSWPARHPVWTGALIGGAAGAATGCAIVNDPEVKCEFYVMTNGLVFAGVGALAGWVWSKVK